MPLAVVRSVMLTHEWFRSISEPFQEALLARGKSRLLNQSEHLFEAASRGDGLYCVLAGSVSVQSRDRDGNAPVLIVVGPGHWFGELSMLDQHERTHDAVALEATNVWHVQQAAIEAWLDAHPKHWRDVARLLAGKLRVAFTVIDKELRGEMTGRVAKRLLLLSLGWGWQDASPAQRLTLSQDVLASMLGGSRSSINKALQELKNLGAVRLSYGAIEIADLKRLMAASGYAAAID
ncbi:MAG: Crp/Fnr family transcriptional regulator [Hyphomicrobiales bacterium]|nr:Crp/Fnr family transcriptional regulator [Hyphomicrobiales bacterium]